MSNIYNRSHRGRGAILIGAEIFTVKTHDGIYYIYTRVYGRSGSRPKTATIGADLEMMQEILSCLSDNHAAMIRKTVVEKGCSFHADSDTHIILPFVGGVVMRSSRLGNIGLKSTVAKKAHEIPMYDHLPCIVTISRTPLEQDSLLKK